MYWLMDIIIRCLLIFTKEVLTKKFIVALRKKYKESEIMAIIKNQSFHKTQIIGYHNL